MFILYLTYKKRVVVNIKPFHNECKRDSLSLSLSLSLSHADTHTHTEACTVCRVLMLVVYVNGVGKSGNVEITEEETSHIEPRVREMISCCNTFLTSCCLNEMSGQFITCRPPPQGCLWYSLTKSSARR